MRVPVMVAAIVLGLCLNTSKAQAQCTSGLLTVENCVRVVQSPSYSIDTLDFRTHSPMSGYATATVSCTGATCSTLAPTYYTGSDGWIHVLAIVYTMNSGTAYTMHLTISGSGGVVNATANGIVVSAFSVSSAYPTSYIDPDACVASCFAMRYAFSTVPMVTLNTPQSISLVYDQNRATPRPFIGATVTFVPHAAGISSFDLSAYVNGVAVTFLNGETHLKFNGGGSNQSVRVAGQFDASSYATGVYPLRVVVSAVSGVTETHEINTQLIIVNDNGSSVGNGWTIGGVQRVFTVTSSVGGYLVTDGSGGAIWFRALGVRATDYSILATAGSGFTRTYVNGTVVTFDGTGLETQVADRVGLTTKFGYSGTQLTAVYDPMWTIRGSTGGYWSLGYGATGLSSIVETGVTGGRTTSITTNASHQITRITDPDTYHTDFGYDASGRLDTVTDRGGASTVVAYEASSWLVNRVQLPSVPLDAGSGTTTPGTPVITYVPWQSVGVPTTPTAGSPPASTKLAFLNAKVTDPVGNYTTYLLDSLGHTIREITRSGDTTLATYAGLLPATINYPSGVIDSMVYDGLGRLTKSSSVGDVPVTYTYGPNGQLATVTSSGVRNETRYLNSVGTIDSVRQVGGPFMPAALTRYTYDAATKQVVTVTDPGHHVAYSHYDPVTGNTDSATAGGGGWTKSTFDAYGRPQTVTGPGQPVLTLTYDVMNRVTSLADGVNPSPTQYRYNGVFRTSVVDAKGNLADSTEYNALGWVTASHDLVNPTSAMTYRYNTAGRMTSKTNRRGQMISYEYDIYGELLRKWGTNTTTDSATYYRYLNHVLRIDTWNNVRRFESYSSPASASDSVVTHFAAYWTRVYHVAPSAFTSTKSTSITTNLPAVLTLRTASQDSSTGALGRLTTGQDSVRYKYNIDQVLDSVVFRHLGSELINRHDVYTSQHQVADQQYSAISTFSKVFRRPAHYDPFGRLDRLYTTPTAGTTEQRFTYDSLGRLTQVENRNSCSAFSPIDTAMGMSATCTSVTGTTTYTYDAAGNRTDLGSVVGAGNRLIVFNGDSLDYDADGNLIRRYHPGYDRRYTWSAENLLLGVRNAITGDSVTFAYDPYGRLSRRMTNGSYDRYWIWDGDQLLMILDNAMNRVVDYSYAPGIDRPLASATGTTTANNPYFHVIDAMGNVIGDHTGSGSVGQQLAYDAWGRATTVTGTSANTLRWKGLHWESGAAVGSDGLYYMRARWYDPGLGRFLSEDPIGISGGLNLYVFSTDDPINGADPAGTRHEVCSYTHYYLYIGQKLVDDWKILDKCWEESDPEDALGKVVFRPAIHTIQEKKLNLCTGIPKAPKGVDLQKDLDEAKRHPLNLSWFKSQVQNHARWDFKRRGPEYENYGNFNYGATGSALGVPSEVLVRTAGWYQQKHGDAKSGEGHWWDREGAYGDDPKDQFWIKLGISYFKKDAIQKCQ